eukprot:CAMPEP_0172517080 /NCGR_PEP_ID=MMETSP1066-20121228/281573_1 /TAXON_ID=671091 /ORGANISM="Coscinodiscus wailesii, Strain CCMP2513" /LENGTH=123 /DNA_ID=CAMNT_0013298855 /DNA_START=271 /DNA_END=642 /DNA_ORIENTATION=+
MPAVKLVYDGQSNEGTSDDGKKTFEVLYVSSDRSAEEMSNIVSLMSFPAVAFEASKERADLKKHFDCCAGKEAGELGMAGKAYGIPTLFIIDCATEKIITADGVSDVMSGNDALGKWLEGVGK